MKNRISVRASTKKGYPLIATRYYPLSRDGLNKAKDFRNTLIAIYPDAEVEVSVSSI